MLETSLRVLDDTGPHVVPRSVRPDRLRVLLQFVLVRRLRRPGKEVHVVCSSQIGRAHMLRGLTIGLIPMDRGRAGGAGRGRATSAKGSWIPDVECPQ